MANANQAPLLPEPRPLPRIGRPWFTLSTDHNGYWSESHYRLPKLEWALNHVRGKANTYISQCWFDHDDRLAMHLAVITHGYIDLDTYKITSPANRTIKACVDLVLEHCHYNNIPPPSYIMFSGRGLYTKWAWRDPLSKVFAGRFVAVNKALIAKFNNFGADPQAYDVSRVLRIVGTNNSKSGELIRVIWTNRCDDNKIVTYDFDDFAAIVLPHHHHEDVPERKCPFTILHHGQARHVAEQRHRGGRYAVCWEDWHWRVLCDIERLAERRFPNGIAQEGYRDIFGFLGACQLAKVISAHTLWEECLAWSQKLLPDGYRHSEYKQHVSTLIERAKRAAGGEQVEYGGHLWTPIYTFSRTELIRRLEISADEMRLMTALIDADEKRRRDREATQAKRRAAGMIERSKYEAAAIERAKPWEAEGVSRATWFRRRHLVATTEHDETSLSLHLIDRGEQ